MSELEEAMKRYTGPLTREEHMGEESSLSRVLANEVRRLREENERLQAEQDNAGFIPWRLAQDALDEYTAEVNQLREDLKGGRAKAIRQRDRAEARLREAELVIKTTDKLNEGLRAENARLRALVYRVTAPTASMVEEDDRQAAWNEARAIGLATLEGEEDGS